MSKKDGPSKRLAKAAAIQRRKSNLKDRTLAWPFHIVTDRARLVDRFLDWRVNNRALANNPFADLRAEYGQRTTTPVVRALLNANPEAALEALRPLPHFGSFLGPVMREHVGLMHAMGYRYNTQAERLLRLDRFLQGRPDLSGHPLTELIREWTNTRSTPQHALECHQAGRLLSSVLSRIDPTVERIPSDKRIWRLAKERYRQPYIFRALRKNPTAPPIHAAFSKATNSIFVAARRWAFSSR